MRSAYDMVLDMFYDVQITTLNTIYDSLPSSFEENIHFVKKPFIFKANKNAKKNCLILVTKCKT